MLSCKDCVGKIEPSEVFDFLKVLGVTPENVGAYMDAFKQWSTLEVKLTPVNVVYLAQPGRLVSLPVYDQKIAKFVVGLEVNSVCFFPHPQRREKAPFMRHSEAQSFLEKRAFALGLNDRLTLPTEEDLFYWSQFNRDFEYNSIWAVRIMPSIKRQNGIYWITPKSKSQKICARVVYDEVTAYSPLSEDTMCRVLSVVHIDLLCDFRGQITKSGSLSEKTLKELLLLRKLAG